MKRATITICAFLAVANAYGCESPKDLLTKLHKGSFSPYLRGDASLKDLGYVRRAQDSICVYGLTLVMPNQHGATRLLVVGPDGALRATYLLTLGEFIGLKGAAALVRDTRGRVESIDLGETGVPANVFFDGEVSELFLPK